MKKITTETTTTVTVAMLFRKVSEDFSFVKLAAAQGCDKEPDELLSGSPAWCPRNSLLETSAV